MCSGHGDGDPGSRTLVGKPAIALGAQSGCSLVVVGPLSRHRAVASRGELPIRLADPLRTAGPGHIGPVAAWIDAGMDRDGSLLDPLSRALTPADPRDLRRP